MVLQLKNVRYLLILPFKRLNFFWKIFYSICRIILNDNFIGFLVKIDFHKSKNDHNVKNLIIWLWLKDRALASWGYVIRPNFYAYLTWDCAAYHIWYKFSMVENAHFLKWLNIKMTWFYRFQVRWTRWWRFFNSMMHSYGT